MSRVIGLRRGCLSPEVCGARAAHICGGVDACPTVKPSGVVCTFGTYKGAPYHTQAELDAEADEIENGVADELVRGGSAPNKAAAKGLLTAKEKARIRADVRRGKNVWSQEREDAQIASANKHFTDNKTNHDTNPEVFHG